MRICFYKSKKRALFCTLLFVLFMPVYAQQVDVKGTVVDTNDGTPLIGVNVVVTGTTKGTVTDFDGKFSLSSVPASATLIFKYLGYDDLKVAVNSRTSIDVKLHPTDNSLDEVVVIGYGAVRKRDLTSSIAKVDDKDIEKTPVMSLDQALQGNAAGVLVINTSAQPGGDISIRIRGGSSILAGNTPLIVVDGFPTNENELASLNPSDVLSMEVLKDASATAIYGARGANGVIMVTTKQGEKGAPKLDFQSKIHYNQVRHVLPMLDAPLFKAYDNLGRQTMGYALDNLRPDTLPTYNFQDKIIRPHTITQDYNLTLSGGGQQFNYRLSANILNQPGLIINSEFSRYTLRGKFVMELTKNMNLEANVSSTNTTTQKIQGGDSGGVLRTLMIRPNPPTGDFVNGLYIDEETGETLRTDTEISRALNNQDFTKNRRNDIFSALNWEFVKHLTLRITASYSIGEKVGEFYSPQFIQISQNNIDKNNIAKRSTNTSTKWVNDNTLTYMNSFDKHNVTAMIGQSWESTNSGGFDLQARILEDAFQWIGLDAAQIYDNMSASALKYNYLSYFGRAIYNYDNRYLATVTYRADGSSRFGPNSKWGTFPSISLAWYPTEEKFIPKNNTLSNLKLRVSYGLTGNDRIGSYKSWTTLVPARIIIGGDPKIGYKTDALGDKILGWEKAIQTNAGFDLGLFKNRIYLTMDVYNKETKDLLYDNRSPHSNGYTRVSTNIGNVRNRGIEFEFSSQNLTGAFKWNTSVNAGYNKSTILDLGGDDYLVAYEMTNTINTPITYLIVGQPLGTFYGYKTAGVYKDWNDVYSSESVWFNGTLESHTQPGYPKYVDKNGDGIIDEKDKEVLGHAQPDWTMGFTNTFSYKNFELSVFFNGAFGNSIVNTNKGKVENYRGNNNNQVRYVLNGYRARNPLTGDPGYYSSDRPIAIYSSSQSFHGDYSTSLTDQVIEDGSYLRLKTITLGYSLPNKILKQIGLRTCKLQVSGVNLLTWTRYTGMDPEASSSLGDNNTKLGIDQSSYPASQAIVFGFNIGI